MSSEPIRTTANAEREAQRQRLQQALGPDFELGALLGRGGFAEVYAATDRRLKRQIAVKVLRTDLVFTMHVLERFRREAEAVAQLRHPNIIPIYDVGERAGLVYYCMPRVEGESLADVLEREGRLPPEEVHRILREAASALGAAHAAGIVHRDIKPGNIMLEGPERRVLLMDFGVAKVLAGEDRDLTGSGMAVGTPQYMSPEQACGDPGADHRSDLYALGAVAYQLLTGRPVFERDTPAEVMRAHISTPPPDLASHRHVPAALAAVVMRCLAKRPEERFSSAADLVAALEGGPGSEPPARGDIARGRVVAATVLAFLLAAALVWWRAGRETSPQAVQSVAVLYFDNLSRDSSDLYLAEGLTEEIATRLGGVGRLLVKSRNAVRRAQAEMAGDVAALGRALAVRYLVEGSVRRAGPRVRVTVSLVTTADGFRVWSAEFDRATMDLLTLQEEIAREVAVMIAGRLLPQERATLARRPTADAMAYDHFLRANHHLSRRGPQALAQAIHEYREAVRRDSGFTQAQAREALAYAIALWWGWRPDGAPAESLLARGLAATDRILARDSAVADAWTARGFLLTFRHPRSYEGVEEAFRSAFALEPDNIEGLQQYAWVKSTTGDDSAAAAAYRRILALEPSRAITYSALAWHVPNLGSRHAEALRLLDSAVAIDPSAFFLYPLRATVRLELGDTAGARQDAETAVRLSPADYTMMAEAVRAEVSARTGEPQADRLLRDLLRRLPEPAAPSPLDASFVGSALVAAGRHEQALALLERVRPQGAALWFFLRFPGFGPLRGNPRFEALLAASRPPTIRE